MVGGAIPSGLPGLGRGEARRITHARPSSRRHDRPGFWRTSQGNHDTIELSLSCPRPLESRSRACRTHSRLGSQLSATSSLRIEGTRRSGSITRVHDDTLDVRPPVDDNQARRARRVPRSGGNGGRSRTRSRSVPAANSGGRPRLVELSLDHGDAGNGPRSSARGRWFS